MSTIVIQRDDGGLSLLHLVDGVDPAQEVARWEAHTGHTTVSWRDGTNGPLPSDRTFRAAWEDTGASVAVNMPKAREIHMDRIRKGWNGRMGRDQLLRELDIEYMRADELDDASQKTLIVQRKQVLRDIPQTVDMTQFTTPEDLAAYWPADLTEAV